MSKIVIVGSGPGLAEATAQRFGREGWRVVLLSRSEAKLAAQVETLKVAGMDVSSHVCDAADLERLDRIVRDEDADGGIDFLCFNAATIRQATLTEQTIDAIATDLMVNVGGGMVAARAAIPGMAARRSGTIMFSGGGLSYEPSHRWAVLGASKAALYNLTQALAGDPACADLRVANMIIPEMIDAAAAERIANLYYDVHHQPGYAGRWDLRSRPDEEGMRG